MAHTDPTPKDLRATHAPRSIDFTATGGDGWTLVSIVRPRRTLSLTVGGTGACEALWTELGWYINPHLNLPVALRADGIPTCRDPEHVRALSEGLAAAYALMMEEPAT